MAETCETIECVGESEKNAVLAGEVLGCARVREIWAEALRGD